MTARVFVVDDDPVIRQLLRAVPTSDGYDVDVAVDGTDGLSRFADFRPDIVLVDVMMPGADGFELCQAIRADKRLAIQPNVILLTATATLLGGASHRRGRQRGDGKAVQPDAAPRPAPRDPGVRLIRVAARTANGRRRANAPKDRRPAGS